MVAVVLFVGGAVVALIEGYEQIRHPHASDTGIAFSLVVLGIAFVFEYVIAYRPAIKEFNKVRSGRSIVATVRDAKDPALLVVVFEDTAALLGLTIAAAGLTLAEVTGWAQWDGIASMLIGVLLAAVAFVLAFEVKALLVGEAATREDRSRIRAAILSVPEVASITRLLTMQLAPNEILVNLDVDIDRGLSRTEVEQVIDPDRGERSRHRPRGHEDLRGAGERMRGTGSAPASSANLGPGFDTVALALDLRCNVVAHPSDEWVIHEKGETFTPRPEDLVVRAVESAVGRPMRLEIDNEVPRSRGLGSSAAVSAAATCAAIRAVGGDPGTDDIFALVAELEGHADNAAATVYGGLVVAHGTHWRHLPLADSLRFVVGIPDDHLSTHMARAALSLTVERSAAARSLGRFGMLLEGLRTGDPAALRLAGGDELHEKPRAHLSPITVALIESSLEGGAYHAAWSGAGPAVLVVTDEDHLADVLAAAEKALNGAGEVMRLDVATTGLV